MDGASAKIEARTRMSFKIKRDLGYEAGEYKVTVRDTRNGQVVGTATNIVFEGQNEIIDRRAMVFSGEKKKKPEEKKPEEKKSDDGDGDKAKSSGESKGDGDKAAEKKSSGCSVAAPSSSTRGELGWLAGLGLGAALLRRRSRGSLS